MEPGFGHFGIREAWAVLLAVVIIVDWAAWRYGSRRNSRRRSPNPSEVGTDPG